MRCVWCKCEVLFCEFVFVYPQCRVCPVCLVCLTLFNRVCVVVVVVAVVGIGVDAVTHPSVRCCAVVCLRRMSCTACLMCLAHVSPELCVFLLPWLLLLLPLLLLLLHLSNCFCCVRRGLAGEREGSGGVCSGAADPQGQVRLHRQ